MRRLVNASRSSVVLDPGAIDDERKVGALRTGKPRSNAIEDDDAEAVDDMSSKGRGSSSPCGVETMDDNGLMYSKGDGEAAQNVSRYGVLSNGIM